MKATRHNALVLEVLALAILTNGSGCLSPEQMNDGDTGGADSTSVSPLLLAPATSALSAAVVAGSQFACALLVSGHVKCWGDNSSGQLGLGDTSERGFIMQDLLGFVDLGAGRTAKAIAAGGATACAILDTNDVKCWGDNSSGQLGLGDTAARGDVPGEMGSALPAVSLGSGRTAKAISVGGGSVCAVLDNNQLKCWGNNSAGQLGQNDVNNRGDNSGELGGNLSAIFLGTGRTAKAVAAGGSHTCAILDNNAVRCWGHNEYGQCGVGTHLGTTGPIGATPGSMQALVDVNLGTSRTAKVFTNPIGILAAAGDRTCAVLDNNALKCWGKNDGQIVGVGLTASQDSKVGEIQCEISAPGAGCPGGISNAQISLGTGSTARTAKSVAMSFDHTCAQLDNNQVKCWGDNESGQLGLGDTTTRGTTAASMGNGLPSVSLGTGRTARAVAAGYGFSCVVLDNDKLKCWGNGEHWKLGNASLANIGDQSGELGNSLATVKLGSRAVKSFVAGAWHTCAIFNGGPMTCWGSSLFGGLGLSQVSMGGTLDTPSLGYTVNLGSNPKAAAAGDWHTCAILSNDQIKCWGGNSTGQLGLGDTTNRSVPASSTVSLGTGLSALAVTAGQMHTCARLNNSQVKCWGDGGQGQLGLGNTTARGVSSGQMGDSLPAVSLGTGLTALAVAAGELHTCALLSSNQVKCWGFNDSGQLGLGNTSTRGDGPNEMGNSLPTVSLGTGRSAKAIATGAKHTCVILDTNAVKCWGGNDYGQLGLGDTSARGNNSGEMGDSLPTVSLGTGRTAKAIAARSYSTCALLDNNTVKCWGYNTEGELGLGDLAHRGDASGEMGNSLPALGLSAGGGLIATAIAIGGNHACALLNSTQLNCWGNNAHGEIGIPGSPVVFSTPRSVPIDLGLDP